MDEISIRDKIREALTTPAPSRELVDSTVNRAKAIEAGREAEKRLEALGSEKPDRELVAQGVIGRLMLTRKAPAGQTGESMVQQLAGNKKFGKLADRPASELVTELKSGKLIRQLGISAAKAKEVSAPAKQPPVKSADQIKMR